MNNMFFRFPCTRRLRGEQFNEQTGNCPSVRTCAISYVFTTMLCLPYSGQRFAASKSGKLEPRKDTARDYCGTMCYDKFRDECRWMVVK